MGSLSVTHWGLLLASAFLFLGRGRFSAAMADLGRGLKSFRSGLKEGAAPGSESGVRDQ